MGGVNSYLLLGHGAEDPINFNSRKKIPKGITLVTLAQCAELSYDEEVCSMVEAFTKPENKKIFDDPLSYKGDIVRILNGKDIHIYTGEQLYPSLTIQMFLDWPTEENTKFMKSGTYKFPLDADLFQMGEGSTFCEKIFKFLPAYTGHFSKKFPKEYNSKLIFDESLMPTVADVDKIETTNPDVLKKQLLINVDDIFTECGSGIYYFIVCREITSLTSPQSYVNNILTNETEERYKPYYGRNWIQHIPSIIPLLNENISTANPTFKPITIKLRNKYRNLHGRINSIRRNSIRQQQQRAGKRRTRKIHR